MWLSAKITEKQEITFFSFSAEKTHGIICQKGKIMPKKIGAKKGEEEDVHNLIVSELNARGTFRITAHANLVKVR